MADDTDTVSEFPHRSPATAPTKLVKREVATIRQLSSLYRDGKLGKNEIEQIETDLRTKNLSEASKSIRYLKGNTLDSIINTWPLEHQSDRLALGALWTSGVIAVSQAVDDGSLTSEEGAEWNKLAQELLDIKNLQLPSGVAVMTLPVVAPPASMASELEKYNY